MLKQYIILRNNSRQYKSNCRYLGSRRLEYSLKILLWIWQVSCSRWTYYQSQTHFPLRCRSMNMIGIYMDEMKISKQHWTNQFISATATYSVCWSLLCSWNEAASSNKYQGVPNQEYLSSEAEHDSHTCDLLTERSMNAKHTLVVQGSLQYGLN